MNDIAEDTFNVSQTCPPLHEFFSGKTVGLTGGTGFLGQGLVEKLLRVCPDVKKIMLLIRKKKNVTPEERLQEHTQQPAFDILRKLQPNFAEKLHCIPCDLENVHLGLDIESITMLQRDCDIFIHSAATLRFTENLRIAFVLNVQCVRRLLAVFESGMNKLQAFVHISTAYSHCDRDIIDEQLYDTGIDYLDLESSLRWMTDDLISRVTPDILGKRPNTYTFTKALAEDVIAREASHLPVCIVRPSMIIPALNEPMPGWCINMYGPTAFLISYGKGITRAVIADKTVEADLTPVDFVVNAVLTAAVKTACDAIGRKLVLDYETDSGVWSVGNGSGGETESPKGDRCSGVNPPETGCSMERSSVPIYHINTSTKNPLLISEIQRLVKLWYDRFPSEAFRTPELFITNNRALYDTVVFAAQTVPAFAVDVWLTLCGKKRRMTKLNNRIKSYMDVFEFFFVNTFRWGNTNVDHLRKSLSIEDKKVFNIDTSTFIWEDYFEIYVRGCNKFILQEDETKYEDSRKARKRLRVVEMCLSSAAALGVLGVASAFGWTSVLWSAGNTVMETIGLSFFA